jgi:hypothetical protein
MEKAANDVSEEEILSMIVKCDELLEILERNSVWNENEYQKNRSKFIAGYTKWYRTVLPVIRDLIPERADKFQNIFRTTKRTGINDYTFTIQDYIHGIYLENRLKVYTDGITSKRLKEQKEILMDAIPRIDGFSFDINRFVKINPIRTGMTSFSTKDSAKLINLELDDIHYRQLKHEINATFKNGLFISTFMLSRKLIENIMLDILKTRFPPVSNENIDIYFDKEHEVHKDLNLLIDVFEHRKEEIPINSEELTEFIKELNLFKLKEDVNSHSINEIPDSIKIRKYHIEEIIEGLLDIYLIVKEEGTVTN